MSPIVAGWRRSWLPGINHLLEHGRRQELGVALGEPPISVSGRGQAAVGTMVG